MQAATNADQPGYQCQNSDALAGIALWVLPELLILVLAGCLLLACHVIT